MRVHTPSESAARWSPDSLKICTDVTRLPENRPALDALTLGRALMALALAGHWLKCLRYLHRVSVCRAVLGGLSHALWSLFVLGLLLVVVMASLAQGLVLTLGFSSSSFRYGRNPNRFSCLGFGVQGLGAWYARMPHPVPPAHCTPALMRSSRPAPSQLRRNRHVGALLCASLLVWRLCGAGPGQRGGRP